MVQKGKIRNEWIDAYLEIGSLAEVPEEYVSEVKERAAARLGKGVKEKGPVVVEVDFAPSEREGKGK